MLEFITVHWVKVYAFLSIAFYFTVWAMKKTYPTKECVEDIDRRLTLLEHEVKQLPNQSDMHKLEVTIISVDSKLDGMAQQLDNINRTIEMLLENELKGDK